MTGPGSGSEPSEPTAAVVSSEAEDVPAEHGTGDETATEPGKKRRRRRPTLTELGAIVALVGAVVALVFKLAPGCEPQPPSNVAKAEISDVREVHPVSFKRFLQRQQIPIPPDVTAAYLARKGVMVEFHYEIIGLSHERLPLGWDVSDATTNEIVAAKHRAYELMPSRYDDAGDWAVWAPAPKPGRDYYVTVTIFKPQGPPYELKHFQTDTFPGFPSK